MVQRRAARWVTSRYHPHDSVTNMIETLGWDTIEHRRAVARVLLLHKIVNNLITIDPGENLCKQTRKSRHAIYYAFKKVQ